LISTLLDIRRIIAGLLGLYGVILVVAGIVGSTEEKNKAAGVNINLWVGLVLLLMATFFLVWALTRPLSEELEEAEAEGSATGGADRAATSERERPETAGPEESR
jgi:drug/metabolite transporter (DMT)-like permease